MKITVSLTIDIPRESWKYLGTDEANPTANKVRAVVRDQLLYDVQQLAWIDETNAKVTMK